MATLEDEVSFDIQAQAFQFNSIFEVRCPQLCFDKILRFFYVHGYLYFNDFSRMRKPRNTPQAMRFSTPCHHFFSHTRHSFPFFLPPLQIRYYSPDDPINVVGQTESMYLLNSEFSELSYPDGDKFTLSKSAVLFPDMPLPRSRTFSAPEINVDAMENEEDSDGDDSIYEDALEELLAPNSPENQNEVFDNNSDDVEMIDAGSADDDTTITTSIPLLTPVNVYINPAFVAESNVTAVNDASQHALQLPAQVSAAVAAVAAAAAPDKKNADPAVLPSLATVADEEYLWPKVPKQVQGAPVRAKKQTNSALLALRFTNLVSPAAPNAEAAGARIFTAKDEVTKQFKFDALSSERVVYCIDLDNVSLSSNDEEEEEVNEIDDEEHQQEKAAGNLEEAAVAEDAFDECSIEELQRIIDGFGDFLDELAVDTAETNVALAAVFGDKVEFGTHITNNGAAVHAEEVEEEVVLIDFGDEGEEDNVEVKIEVAVAVEVEKAVAVAVSNEEEEVAAVLGSKEATSSIAAADDDKIDLSDFDYDYLKSLSFEEFVAAHKAIDAHLDRETALEKGSIPALNATWAEVLPAYATASATAAAVAPVAATQHVVVNRKREREMVAEELVITDTIAAAKRVCNKNGEFTLASSHIPTPTTSDTAVAMEMDGPEDGEMESFVPVSVVVEPAALRGVVNTSVYRRKLRSSTRTEQAAAAKPTAKKTATKKTAAKKTAAKKTAVKPNVDNSVNVWTSRLRTRKPVIAKG
jgi:hypothetical protein